MRKIEFEAKFQSDKTKGYIVDINGEFVTPLTQDMYWLARNIRGLTQEEFARVREYVNDIRRAK